MYSTTQLIAADPAIVWRHLTVPELMQEWMSSVQGLRTSDGAPLEDRSTLIFNARGREHSSKVVDFEEGRTFALRSVQGPVTAVYRYSLAPDPGGTSATLEADCNAVGPMRLISPIIKRLMWLTDRGQVKLLKDAIENGNDRG